MRDDDDDDELPGSLTLEDARATLLARRRAERELAKERERLQITLASIGDGVISTDTEGRVTFLNGVAEALTGWTQAEAAGRPLVEVFSIIHERTRRPADNPALRALRDGVVVELANHTLLIARDGSERPIDDSAAPIRGDGGAPVGAILVFRDVTERRRAEEARARLAAIVDWEMTTIGDPLLDVAGCLAGADDARWRVERGDVAGTVGRLATRRQSQARNETECADSEPHRTADRCPRLRPMARRGRGPLRGTSLRTPFVHRASRRADLVDPASLGSIPSWWASSGAGARTWPWTSSASVP